MSDDAAEPLILSRREGSIARLTLNRPRAINALNSEMFRGLHAALRGLNGGGGVDRAEPARAIVLDGAGERGFCGGGDIKEISASPKPRDIYRLEYELDHAVHASRIPVVSFLDGISMGGGIGIGGHAAHRIVTERSRLAMPEVRIGIIPDVGGHLLLANAPGRLGEYLAITAGEMTAGDAIALGFADHFVPSDRLDALREALAAGRESERPDRAAIAEIISGFAVDPPPAPLLAVREWFDPIADAALGGSDDGAVVLEDPAGAARRLVQALEASGLAAARETAGIVRGMCPTSIALTLAQLARTRTEELDLAGVLEDDYRVVSRLSERPDFVEGVRAQVIDKDRNPKWSPERLEDLGRAALEELLAPLRPGEDALGLGD